jgi:inosine-uridine nucleoside N-ribohydrolase
MTPMIEDLFVDSDNALGSHRGDVDDAYAIAAIVRSGLPIAAMASVAGNVSAGEAFENNRRLARVAGYGGRLLHASEAREFLPSFQGRVVALGPLTNVVAASQAREIIIVGANSDSFGRWPPLWPHEFNLTHDRAATHRLFAMAVPLTIIPLNVARRLAVRQDDLHSIDGLLGNYLRDGTTRWLRYLRWRRFTRRFAIYDLAAALYAIDPAGFTMETTTAAIRPNTFIDFGRGTRTVTLCRTLDRQVLWRRFLSLVNG